MLSAGPKRALQDQGASVGVQWRSQQRHAVSREHRRDGLRVGVAAPRDGPELLVELVPAARRVHHNNLARLIGQVQEGVRDPGREIGEATLLAAEDLVADPDLLQAFQNVDGLLLLVVNMQWGTASRRDLDDEVVEGPIRVLARDLEDEVPAGTGPESQSLAKTQNLVLVGRNRHSSTPLRRVS